MDVIQALPPNSYYFFICAAFYNVERSIRI